MVYQLAKTSPLLTGQVKMNMIMNGTTVTELQYVPISDYIPFNYNNPCDVLNYTHGENIKMLHDKISSAFFLDVLNPELSPERLHRYDTVFDDTHEGTYEMGMKRIDYQRYRKQFSFFCPFWCDDTQDFENIEFDINLANNEGRIMYSSPIRFTNEIRDYLNNIYSSLGFDGKATKNEDLVYVSLEKSKAYIKGINVTTGELQTVDTSYVIRGLLDRERPVMETDNTILNLFGSNDIICTQLFNYNFVFNLCDLIPLSLLNDFLGHRINVYIDMYSVKTVNGNVSKSLISVKDLYSNYDFIPKFDIYHRRYTDSNVLDYLHDNTAVDMICKNRLSQSTFHWALQNKPNIMFNLYNGFAPDNDGEPVCTSISGDSSDMFVDMFSENKNPLAIFKYTVKRGDLTDITRFESYADDEANYYTIDLSPETLNGAEYQFFGNMLLNNEKIRKYIDDCKAKYDVLDVAGSQITSASIPASFKNNYKKSISDLFLYPRTGNGMQLNAMPLLNDYADYKQYSLKYDDFINCYKAFDLKKIHCGIIRIDHRFTYQMVRDALPEKYMLTELECIIDEPIVVHRIVNDTEENIKYTSQAFNSHKNFMAAKIENDEMYLMLFSAKVDDALKNTINFFSMYKKDFIRDIVDRKDSTYTAIDLDAILAMIRNLSGLVETTSITRPNVQELNDNTNLLSQYPNPRDVIANMSDLINSSNGIRQGMQNSQLVINGRIQNIQSSGTNERFGQYISQSAQESIAQTTDTLIDAIQGSTGIQTINEPYVKTKVDDTQEPTRGCYSYSFNGPISKMYVRPSVCDKLFRWTIRDPYMITQKRLIYNMLNVVASIVKCVKFPNVIEYDQTFETKDLHDIFADCNETEMIKADRYVDLYRYDNNLLPFFIDLDDPVFSNSTYWNKQYNQTLLNMLITNYRYGLETDTAQTVNIIENEREVIYSKSKNGDYFIKGINDSPNSIIRDKKLFDTIYQQWNKEHPQINDDPDNIAQYNTYANTKLLPVYKSIGYYAMKNLDRTDYTKFYLDDWDAENNLKYNYIKERCWYKNNSMLYLPDCFACERVKPSDVSITEDDLTECISEVMWKLMSDVLDPVNIKDVTYFNNLVKYCIKDMYICTFDYDYYIPAQQELIEMGYDENYTPSPIDFQKYNIKFVLK